MTINAFYWQSMLGVFTNKNIQYIFLLMVAMGNKTGAVSPRYKVPFAFNGKLNKIIIDLK